MNRSLLLAFSIAFFIISCTQNQGKSMVTKKPNILIIYVDDLGYADVSCYGATAVQTPNVDALAKAGLKFTDAHCSASTCTPSRYALLTGSYAFRNNAAILPGDAPLIIDPNKGTIASMLKKAGYATGVIGKWHLGLGDGKPNWNADIKPGPLEIGFDYSFLIPATPDRVPTVYVEDHKVVNLDKDDPITINYNQRVGNDPIGLEHPEMLKMQADSQHSGTIINGISRIGFMKGGHKAYWKDEDFASVLNDKVTEFITQHKDRPFFLYYSLPSIHVPRAPNAKFVGATKMGPRGDDIVQMDWMTGEVMKTLKKLGLEDNTLVIFSSDNGPVLNDGYADKAVQLLGNHHPAGIYKGGKYSAYEGGTRVPTITYWPNEIHPGESDALISQVDIYASLAQLVGEQVDHHKAAPDSKDFLPVLLGKSKEGRKQMIEEAFTLSLRSGEWKYIDPVKAKTPDWLKNKDVPTGLQSTPQLYNLEKDPGENYNLADQYPREVKELSEKLNELMQK
ncbi:sulfatase-like hydrolase/transferase [Ginsengibacter hankyongi]|uniref:Sulfatase-like hydrolase/transferase n=1 Tax=Ginsengibacter hankyongi TaxID=2607284 RepID=A0A5J5IPJ0_9BACT|nr:sulfatase-like hydrolase/transferase [Ginsengibacter hankyongi]KAA9041904.1 sulfatase-like hydrolase/transferase [Ginsengibacter hankyongi]